MGLFLERDDSTNGKIIRTGDNVRILETGKKGFVIAVLENEYMVSVDGNVENFFLNEIEWID